MRQSGPTVVEIDPDDFEAWKAHPITKLLLEGLKRYSDRSKWEWLEMSWYKGEVNAITLASLKGSATLAGELAYIDLEDLEMWANEGREPERDISD
jgi:hypothetical protein